MSNRAVFNPSKHSKKAAGQATVTHAATWDQAAWLAANHPDVANASTLSPPPSTSAALAIPGAAPAVAGTDWAAIGKKALVGAALVGVPIALYYGYVKVVQPKLASSGPKRSLTLNPKKVKEGEDEWEDDDIEIVDNDDDEDDEEDDEVGDDEWDE